MKPKFHLEPEWWHPVKKGKRSTSSSETRDGVRKLKLKYGWKKWCSGAILGGVTIVFFNFFSGRAFWPHRPAGSKFSSIALVLEVCPFVSRTQRLKICDAPLKSPT
jgi:hypothetical protein